MWYHYSTEGKDMVCVAQQSLLHLQIIFVVVEGHVKL